MSYLDDELESEMLELAQNMGVDIMDNEDSNSALPEDGEICDDGNNERPSSINEGKITKKKGNKRKAISDDAESLLRAERRLKEQALNDKEKRTQRKDTLHLPPTKPKVPCKYWMEGRCSKASLCTYSHSLKPNKTFNEAKMEGEVCRFHIQGTCLKGDSCLFSHDLSLVPCKFYHIHGSCTKSPCKYSHLPFKGEDERRLFFANIMKDSIGSTQVQDPRLQSADHEDDESSSSSFFKPYSSEEECLKRMDITDYRDLTWIFKISDCHLQTPNKDPR